MHMHWFPDLKVVWSVGQAVIWLDGQICISMHYTKYWSSLRLTPISVHRSVLASTTFTYIELEMCTWIIYNYKRVWLIGVADGKA